MGRQQRSWTDEQLVDAVRASSTFKGVLRALGLKKGSTRYLQNHIEKAGLDTSHFHQASRANPRDEALKALVASDRTAPRYSPPWDCRSPRTISTRSSDD
jgi:hypothetical protein